MAQSKRRNFNFEFKKRLLVWTKRQESNQSTCSRKGQSEPGAIPIAKHLGRYNFRVNMGASFSVQFLKNFHNYSLRFLSSSSYFNCVIIWGTKLDRNFQENEVCVAQEKWKSYALTLLNSWLAFRYFDGCICLWPTLHTRHVREHEA